SFPLTVSRPPRRPLLPYTTLFRSQLVADGATVTPAESWRLPLLGEDTQDFGPTPYYFEPAMTYRGVYFPHFHDGTDIAVPWGTRSEEHTSELQSPDHLVCRLLLEK